MKRYLLNTYWIIEGRQPVPCIRHINSNLKQFYQNPDKEFGVLYKTL